MMRRALPAVVVVLVTDAAILGSVWRNRTSEPRAIITITERELPLWSATDRDSSRRVRLATAASFWSSGDSASLPWLAPEKQNELGIRCPNVPMRQTFTISCGLPRRMYTAYEFDGPAFVQMIERMRRHEVDLERQMGGQTTYAETIAETERYGTRLVSVDASIDADALRRRYPDMSRYIILPSAITGWRSQEIDPERRQPPKQTESASIAPVTTQIVVPVRFHAILPPNPSAWDSFQRRDPRYKVRLAVGSHHEPWIESVEPIDSAAPPH